ncbi:MAG: rubrerythrin family protein [Chloroflexi bacterium]|nr:rubrerythrin family protein [Chloroflexota bacterium]
MRRMTEDNLRAAFAGESQAHMRYLFFADKAREEGKPDLARLFQAIAFAERVHAFNHYEALGQIRSSADNLGVAIAGESYEVEDMYPAYFEVAKLQKERDALRSTNYALRAEEDHLRLYTEAKGQAVQQEDAQVGEVYVCSVCGHTVLGGAPDRCPVCGRGPESYRQF